MNENNTVNTVVNVELPPSVDNAMKNLSDKPTQNIGTTLADIWFIVFGGISAFAERQKIKYAHDLEQYRQELDSSIKSIPESKKCEPSLQVTAQALENSKYCIEEKELRDMFTSLISKSMNSDFSDLVHPSFAEIIKQMSVLDAIIIRKFKESPSGKYPLCDYNHRLNGSGFTPLLQNVFLALPNVSLKKCSQSLSSLARLGLIEIPEDLYLNNDAIYKPFNEHPYLLHLQKMFPDSQITVEKKVASLTPLGHLFVMVCVPN